MAPLKQTESPPAAPESPEYGEPDPQGGLFD